MKQRKKKRRYSETTTNYCYFCLGDCGMNKRRTILKLKSGYLLSVLIIFCSISGLYILIKQQQQQNFQSKNLSVINSLNNQFEFISNFKNSTTTTQTSSSLGDHQKSYIKAFRPKLMLTNQIIDQVFLQSSQNSTVTTNSINTKYSQQQIENFLLHSKQLKESLQVKSVHLLSLQNVTFLLEPFSRGRGSGIGFNGHDRSRNSSSSSSRWKKRLTSQWWPKCIARNEQSLSQKEKKKEKEKEKHERGVKLLIVVNSKWNNYQRRQKLRSSWLNPTNLNKILCDHHHHQRDLKGKQQQQRPRRRQRLAINRIDYLFALGRPTELNYTSTSSYSTSTSTKSVVEVGIKRIFDREEEEEEEVRVKVEEVRERERVEWLNGELSSNSNRRDLGLGLVKEESKRFDDILVINLYENYRTMSLKHLSIFKWLLQMRVNLYNLYDNDKRQNEQSKEEEEEETEDLNQIVVLKCDDDAQVDLDQLITFANSQLSSSSSISDEVLNDDSLPVLNDHENQMNNEQQEILSSMDDKREELFNSSQSIDLNNWIMCARFTKDSQVLRSNGKKWQLTKDEYPFDTFPAYCSGLAYLAPLKLIQRLYTLSHVLLLTQNQPEQRRQISPESEKQQFEQPLWIDDVFITGILLESMSNKPKILKTNGQFCYTKSQQLTRATLNNPCMVWEDHSIDH